MNIFLTLFEKLIPLYIIIGLGFIAGKFLQVKKESIAPLLMYILSPTIVFNASLKTTITTSTIMLPVLMFIVSCTICILFFWIGHFFWQDSTRNILAFAAGSGNTGYFGIPVAMLILPANLVNIFVIAALSLIFYENSLGFFITAKGNYTVRESLLRLIRLPTLYAFFLGLLLNISRVHLGSIYDNAETNFQGAYTILGMMIIGLGLASVASYKLDLKFIGLAFLAKFVAWPALMTLIIAINTTILHIYDPTIYKVMILLSIVPIAANTVTFATQLNVQPGKASLTVFLGTLFALFYIPLITTYFLR